MNGSLVYGFRNNRQNSLVPKFWSPVGIYEECERTDTVLSSILSFIYIYCNVYYMSVMFMR